MPGKKPVSASRRLGFPARGPRVSSRWLRGGLGLLGRLGARVTRSVKPTTSELPARQMARILSEQIREETLLVQVTVTVAQRFGAGTLIEVEGVVPGGCDSLRLREVLDRVVKIAWHNPWLAPVVVRAKVQIGEGGQVVDIRELGFQDDTAYALELFDRYGSPRADSEWRP